MCIHFGLHTGPVGRTMSSCEPTKCTGWRAIARKTRRLSSANSSMTRSNRGSRQIDRKAS